MRYVAAMLLFLFAHATGYSQLVVGDSVTQGELAKAKETLTRAIPKKIDLKAGEFFTITAADKYKGMPVTWYTPPSPEDNPDTPLYDKHDLAPNETTRVFAIKPGDTKPKSHTIGPFPNGGTVIIANSLSGQSVIALFVNGDPAAKAGPNNIDNIKVTVTGETPKPPKPIDPPVEEQLTKDLRAAMNQDIAAGKANPIHLGALEGIYQSFSTDPLNKLNAANTAGDVESLLNSAREQAGIPEWNLMYPALRQRLRLETLKTLGLQDDPKYANTPVNADAKRLLKAYYAKVAAALDAISK